MSFQHELAQADVSSNLIPFFLLAFSTWNPFFPANFPLEIRKKNRFVHKSRSPRYAGNVKNLIFDHFDRGSNFRDRGEHSRT